MYYVIAGLRTSGIRCEEHAKAFLSTRRSGYNGWVYGPFPPDEAQKMLQSLRIRGKTKHDDFCELPQYCGLVPQGANA